MFGYSSKNSAKNAANAYSNVGIETGVLAADPHKLIVLLFDGAIKAIGNAALQMEAGNIAEKGRSISHAIAIVERGLRASLNKEVGGNLATNLDSLYGYMTKELLMANHKNDMSKLVEVKRLLGELREAWEQIAPAKAMNEAPVPMERDNLAPRKTSHVSA